MFKIYSSDETHFCGAVSPFGDKFLTSAVPTDLPQTYSIVIGRPPEKVRIDVSNIHVTIVPPAPARQPAAAKPARRRAAAKRR